MTASRPMDVAANEDSAVEIHQMTTTMELMGGTEDDQSDTSKIIRVSDLMEVTMDMEEIRAMEEIRDMICKTSMVETILETKINGWTKVLEEEICKNITLSLLIETEILFKEVNQMFKWVDQLTHIQTMDQIS